MLKTLQNDQSPLTRVDRLDEIIASASKIIHGKEQELKLALTTLISNGHLLIEDMPGMGKTTFVMCLAKLLGLKFSRIQFTNDLLPSDILGTNIFNQSSGKFEFFKGPIFSEAVLGDELNRASPKTQSAFLQAMEERAITLDGVSHTLPKPFFVIATQNPQSQVGTNPLPESQLDRFMMKLNLGYPNRRAEFELLRSGDSREQIEGLMPVLAPNEIFEIQSQVKNITVAPALVEFVQDILSASRSKGFELSPRAGLLLIQAARGWAYMHGRRMVLPEDVQDVGVATLVHRLPSQNPQDIQRVLQEVRVP